MTNNLSIFLARLDCEVIIGIFLLICAIQTLAFNWIPIFSMLMKTTYSCQNFHKLLHFLCHSRRRQEQQQRKLDISNVSFFTSAFKKNVYNRLYNRLQLSFVIWLITVMHGYKDGVLLALKLLSNRFEFFFQHPKFSYVLFSR